MNSTERTEKELAAENRLAQGKTVTCEHCGLPTRKPLYLPLAKKIFCQTCVIKKGVRR